MSLWRGYRGCRGRTLEEEVLFICPRERCPNKHLFCSLFDVKMQNVGKQESKFLLLKPYKLWYFTTEVPKISIVIITFYCVAQFYFKENFLLLAAFLELIVNYKKARYLIILFFSGVISKFKALRKSEEWWRELKWSSWYYAKKWVAEAGGILVSLINLPIELSLHPW